MNKIKSIIFILKYYLKATPAYLFIYYVQVILNALIFVVNSIYKLRIVFNAFESRIELYFILTQLLLIIATNILLMLFNTWFKRKYSPKCELTVQEKIQKDLFSKATEINLRYYDDNNFYDNYILALRESESIGKSILTNTGNILFNIVSISTITAILFTIDLKIVGLILFSVFLGFIVDIKIAKKQANKDFETIKYNRKLDYYKRVFYLYDHIEEMKSIRSIDFLFNDYAETYSTLRDINKQCCKPLVKLNALKGIMESILTSFSVYFLLIYKLVITKTISIGDFSASLSSIWRLSDQMTQLVGNVSGLYKGSIYCSKIIEFLNIDTLRLKSDNEKRLLPTPKEAKEIKIQNLYFSYDGKKNVLEDINLTIEPRQKIAIVGRNGSGKTTLIKIILGLYNNYQGNILLDNERIDSYNPLQLRDYFSCLFQDFQIYATTLEKNIYMDNVTNEDTSRILNVIKQVGFEDKFKTLPNGLQTIVLQEYDENAIRLSGGENQKVALARILLSKSCIVILDEPSSALDPLAERDFNNLLLSAFDDRTVILISHRLFTTQNADKIFLLSNGKLEEQGTHDFLMNLNGEYAYMYKIQKEKFLL